MKFGGEYRRIESDFQFLGSTEITYNSINDFIDNKPNQVAVTLDSPVFRPQQFYAIGFAQDSWRVADRLTLELGLRYDYYSVVKEAEDRAKPFFVEDNAFGSDAGQLLQPRQEQFFAAALSGLSARRPDGRCAAVLASSTAPASSKTASSRSRTSSSGDACRRRTSPNNGLAYPVDPAQSANLLSIRGYTHHYPNDTTCSTASACHASCRARST